MGRDARAEGHLARGTTEEEDPPAEDKTWFAVVLAGGVLGFAFALLGFAAMIAYVIAGPDGMAYRQPQFPATAPRPSTFAPTS